jgi:hypothetical protein
MSVLLLGAGKGTGGAVAPIAITSAATFSIVENSTAVATLSATGGLGSFIWTKIGGADTARFTLTSGGVLTFTSAPDFDAPVDADSNNIYLVQVQASDGVSTPATQSISVTVTDADLDFATVLSASRAGIGSAVIAENHTGRTRIV